MRSLLTALLLMVAGAAEAAPCPFLPATITAPCTITASNASYALSDTLDGAALPADPLTGYQQAILTIAPGVGLLTIDCNGHYLLNTAGYGNRGVGIYGKGTAFTKIKNCQTGGDGMLLGIFIDNEIYPAFGTIDLEGVTLSGSFRGALLRSHDVTVKDSFFVNVGGQTAYPTGYSFGLEVSGDRAKIQRNRFWHVWNRFYTETAGLSCSTCGDGALIEDNRSEIGLNVAGLSCAYWLGLGAGYIVRRNHSARTDKGICAGDASGEAADNTFEGVGESYYLDAEDWTIH